MYGLNSLLIAGVLFFSMAVAMEAGYRIGRIRTRSASDAARTHVNAIQASLLGVLALLLGFTFSLALQRFDKRSEAVVDEANAIGTTYLRAQLLPNSVRSEARKLLQNYVDYRVRAGAVSLDNEAERQAHLANAKEVLDDIWSCALRAVEDDKSPVTAGLFIQSLNETIDSFGRRNAELNRHVPEVIWLLLYGTFLVTGGVLGFSTGLAGHRPSLVTYILIALIVVLTFIIVDLDRPRRGLIRVDQTSLTDLKAAIDLAQSAVPRPIAPVKLSRPDVTSRR